MEKSFGTIDEDMGRESAYAERMVRRGFSPITDEQLTEAMLNGLREATKERSPDSGNSTDQAQPGPASPEQPKSSV